MTVIYRKVEEDLSKVEEELDLQISGTERPSIWKLVGIRFILLPYTLGKVSAKIFYLENALVYLEALITLFNTLNYFPLVVLNCENQYCFMYNY
jgi:hypothetical protein